MAGHSEGQLLAVRLRAVAPGKACALTTTSVLKPAALVLAVQVQIGQLTSRACLEQGIQQLNESLYAEVDQRMRDMDMRRRLPLYPVW